MKRKLIANWPTASGDIMTLREMEILEEIMRKQPVNLTDLDVKNSYDRECFMCLFWKRKIKLKKYRGGGWVIA